MRPGSSSRSSALVSGGGVGARLGTYVIELQDRKQRSRSKVPCSFSHLTLIEALAILLSNPPHVMQGVSSGNINTGWAQADLRGPKAEDRACRRGIRRTFPTAQHLARWRISFPRSELRAVCSLVNCRRPRRRGDGCGLCRRRASRRRSVRRGSGRALSFGRTPLSLGYCAPWRVV